jgi:AAHS family 4-hydroxybenzoate transporter-like MFS transporter
LPSVALRLRQLTSRYSLPAAGENAGIVLEGTDFQPASMTMANLLDAYPWTGYQIRNWLLIAVTVLFEGIDQNLLAVTMPILSRTWMVEPRSFATVTALGTVAILMGSAIAGISSDRIGRRWTLIGATFCYGVATLMSAGAWNVESMGATRFLAGLGLGAALTTAVVSMAEHTPTRKRGIAIALALLGVPLGGIVAGAMGAMLIAAHGWQSVYALGGVMPIVLALFYIAFLPETPAFLRLRDGKGLERYSRKMGVLLLREITTQSVAARAQRGNPLALLAPGLRRNTLLLWAGFFSSLLVSYHVIAWLPALMAQSGATDAVASASLSYVSMGSLAGGISAALLVYFLGSRISMIGGAAASLLVGIWLAFTFDGAPCGAATLWILPMLLIGLSIVNTLFYTILPNVYPENMRGVGIGIGMAMGRLGAVASAYTGAWGLGGGGARFFGVVAVAGLIALVCFGLIDRHQPKAR